MEVATNETGLTHGFRHLEFGGARGGGGKS